MPPAEGDRGDDFVPTDEEVKKPAAPAEEEEEQKPAAETKPDEGEEGTEAKADEGEEGDDKAGERKPPRIRIPKERLDQEIAKRRAAEQRAAERIQELERQIQAQRQSANVTDIEKKIAELDEKYDDAISEGEKSKAKEFRTEIRRLERDLSRAEATNAALNAKQAAVNELRYDMALSQVEMDYPELNPDDEENFAPEQAQEVADLIDALKAKGNSPDAALRKAVKYVMGPPKRAKEAADKADRDVERDGLRRQREEDARKKVADAARRQPARTDEGLDHDKAGTGGKMTAQQISKMSHDEFVKIDEEALRRARGDDL